MTLQILYHWGPTQNVLNSNPTTSVIIYCIEVDSCKMEARLSVEKVS